MTILSRAVLVARVDEASGRAGFSSRGRPSHGAQVSLDKSRADNLRKSARARAAAPNPTHPSYRRCRVRGSEALRRPFVARRAP